MSDTPRIAMTPEQLPRQRIHEVVALPPEPADFDPVVCYGSDALSIFPKRRPSRMHYLGSTEWAWGPMNGRITAYHLHRGRNHWLLYLQDLDPNDRQFEWVVGAYAAISSKDRRQVAIHLMIALWKDEASSCDFDHFHWVNQSGHFTVADWMAIGRAVWEGRP
jgi:hypothetical protein